MSFLDALKFWLAAWLAKFALGLVALVAVAFAGLVAWLVLMALERRDARRRAK